MQVRYKLVDFTWNPAEINPGGKILNGMIEKRREASYFISSKFGKTYMCLKLSIARTGRSYTNKRST